jgi:hypothetical protein
MRRLVPSLILVALLAACGGDDDDPSVVGDAAGTDAAVSGAAPADGGLTVAEALASDLDEPLMVAGYLFVDGDAVRLCDAIAESHPPQCGGAALRVVGLDVSTIDSLQRDGDRGWTEQRISILGEVDGDTITIDAMSQ